MFVSLHVPINVQNRKGKVKRKMKKQYYVTPKGTLATRWTADCSDVEKLMQVYIERGGEVIELVPGVLGYGLTVLQGEGLKTCVVKEIYLNEWSSTHTLRFYNECPKKYAKAIEKGDVA